MSTASTTMVAQRDPVFTVADHLRKARESAGFTREDMAERVGVSIRSITRYEHSGDHVPKSVVLAYAFTTGVRAEWIDPVRCTPRDLNPEPTDSGPAPDARSNNRGRCTVVGIRSRAVRRAA